MSQKIPPPDSRIFYADRKNHSTLCTTNDRMPELAEVFENIVSDKSEKLHENVLSEWTPEMLAKHISDFAIPVLLSAGVVAVDSSKKCGYKTDYDGLLFEQTRTAGARTTANMCNQIASGFVDSDTKDQAVSIYVVRNGISDATRTKYYDDFRQLVKNLLAEPNCAPSEASAACGVIRFALISK